MSAAPTPAATPEEIAAAFDRVRLYFRKGDTRPYAWRVQQLQSLKQLIKQNKDAIRDAVYQDLRRPKFEADLGESLVVDAELDLLLANLATWMKPEAVPTPAVQKPATSKVLKDPKGAVLVLGAWNFPIMLTLLPLASALAAGNTVILKPSEVAPASAALIASVIPRFFPSGVVEVVLGGVEQSKALLELPFNHIFYTGGSAVGKEVMAAAAKNLTPVTLELGGKSPAIVARDANLAVTANRIVAGRFMNCGQVCIAPDYVLVEEGVEQKLLQELTRALLAFYGADPKASPSLGRIVNRRHFDRLMGLLSSHRGEVVVGGPSGADPDDLFIPPTVLRRVDTTAPVMKEEIFGPILPVLTVHSIDDAIAFVNDRPQPLALYVFSSSKATADRVLGYTTSGGAAWNDCVMQCANPHLPFGGVGPSGLGAYHGKTGFDTFSHAKAVLSSPTWIDPSIRYPPYSDKALKLITFLATAKFPLGKPAFTVILALLVYLLGKKYLKL